VLRIRSKHNFYLVGESEKTMEQQQYTVGDRVEQLCAVCGEEKGHIVLSVGKRSQITRVNCPHCGTSGRFKLIRTESEKRATVGTGPAYDWTRTYRKGQAMLHPTFGAGEVTAVIEPKKIDVLFADRVRRLVHSRSLS
jgi:hypothetical protein